MSATLGSFYWLGFETSGHSPDKKRLALLGAQRQSPAAGSGDFLGVVIVELLPVGSDDLLGIFHWFPESNAIKGELCLPLDNKITKAK